MSESKYSTAVMVMGLIYNERNVSHDHDGLMWSYFLKVIDIKSRNDPSIRDGCCYSHAKYMGSSSSKFDSPENGRADDYYEHGSH